MDERRGGLYFREARFFLAGDRDSALRHIHEARGMLGYLRDMQSLGGPPIQVKYATLGDGTVIKAVLMNGQYQAFIQSPPLLGGKENEECEPFWSGLINTYECAQHVIIGSDGEATPFIGVEWFYPSAYQFATTPGIAETYPPDGDKYAIPLYPPDEIPVLEFPVDSEVKTHGFLPATIGTIFSSRYSGEMRVAIQVLLGMGVKLTNAVSITDPIDPIYPYGYLGTTGLVRIPGDSPEFWMVRFPIGDHGILAMRYPICDVSVTEEMIALGLGYVPISGVNFPTDIPKAIESGTVIEMMSLSAFSSLIDDYSPFYPNCGWTFSKSGHEAQNVLYTIVDKSVGETEIIEVLSRRIKFSFTATSEGIACSSSVVESGHLHTTTRQAVPRFPSGNVVWPFLEISFKTTSDDTVGPLHVYYLGDDEQVWRLHNVFHNDPSEDDTNDVPTGGGYPCLGHYYRKVTGPGAVDTWYSLNGEDKTSKTTGTATTYNIEYYNGPAATMPDYMWLGPDVIYRLSDITVWQRSWTELDRYEAGRSSMFVPAFQREGICMLDSTYEQIPAYSRGNLYIGVAYTGEAWFVLSTTPGYFIITAYDPTYTAGLNTCATKSLGMVTSGGIGATGISGSIGRIDGVVAPTPTYFTDTPDEQIIFDASIKFYGASEVVIKTLDEGEFDAAWSVDSEAGQWIYSWTDALNPDQYILTPVDGLIPEYVTNTAYPVTESPGSWFNFIGIA